jgi:predicted amidohydrolase
VLQLAHRIAWGSLLAASALAATAQAAAVPESGDAGPAAGTWRVAMLQFDADQAFGDTERNVERLTAYAEDAAAAGARLVLFPEGSTHGYANPSEVWCRPGRTSLGSRRCRDVGAVAETLPGADGTVDARFTALARRLGVHVVYSAIERDGARYYNTAVMVGPDGLEAKYRKRALYYLDEGYATPGDGPATAALPIGTVGFLICADLNEDAYYREYTDAGVATIVTIMSWDQDPHSGRAAARFLASQARRHGVTLLAADAAAWDGTAAYLPARGPRVRAPLADPAVGEEGLAFADLPVVEDAVSSLQGWRSTIAIP